MSYPTLTFFAMPHLTKRLLLRTGVISLSLVLLFLISSTITTEHRDEGDNGEYSNPQSSPSIGKSWSQSSGVEDDNKWFGLNGLGKSTSKWSLSNGMDYIKSKGNKWKTQSGSSNLDFDGRYEEREEDGWVDLEKDLVVTKYEGGLPGYQVFSNLYLVNSVLTSVIPSSNAKIELPSDDESAAQIDLEFQKLLLSESGGEELKVFPDVKFVMSSEQRGKPAQEDRWKVVDQDIGREEIGKRGYRLGGVTYIFNDPPGGDGYLVYFRHFVLEAFLGATRVLASTLTGSLSVPTPKRIWFPRCGSEPSWRDDRGENAWFLAHALPFATIEDKNGWDDRNTAGLPILLEKVVIIDRWASHSSGGEVGKWGKMNALIPTMSAAQSFWEPIRTNMMRSLGVDGPSEIGSKGLPVVVYVDRQKSSPKMKQSDHDALVEGLMSLTNVAEVHVARISGMSKARQVELLGRAQVIISLHGDELFSTLWMPARTDSLVIELFEDGGFIRDFELLSSGLNHKYIAVQGDHVLTEEKWRETGTTKGDERDKGEISINTELVIRLIEGTLNPDSTATAD